MQSSIYSTIESTDHDQLTQNNVKLKYCQESVQSSSFLSYRKEINSQQEPICSIDNSSTQSGQSFYNLLLKMKAFRAFKMILENRQADFQHLQIKAQLKQLYQYLAKKHFFCLLRANGRIINKNQAIQHASIQRKKSQLIKAENNCCNQNEIYLKNKNNEKKQQGKKSVTFIDDGDDNYNEDDQSQTFLSSQKKVNQENSNSTKFASNFNEQMKMQLSFKESSISFNCQSDEENQCGAISNKVVRKSDSKSRELENLNIQEDNHLINKNRANILKALVFRALLNYKNSQKKKSRLNKKLFFYKKKVAPQKYFGQWWKFCCKKSKIKKFVQILSTCCIRRSFRAIADYCPQQIQLKKTNHQFNNYPQSIAKSLASNSELHNAIYAKIGFRNRNQTQQKQQYPLQRPALEQENIHPNIIKAKQLISYHNTIFGQQNHQQQRGDCKVTTNGKTFSAQSVTQLQQKQQPISLANQNSSQYNNSQSTYLQLRRNRLNMLEEFSNNNRSNMTICYQSKNQSFSKGQSQQNNTTISQGCQPLKALQNIGPFINNIKQKNQENNQVINQTCDNITLSGCRKQSESVGTLSHHFIVQEQEENSIIGQKILKTIQKNSQKQLLTQQQNKQNLSVQLDSDRYTIQKSKERSHCFKSEQEYAPSVENEGNVSEQRYALNQHSKRESGKIKRRNNSSFICRDSNQLQKQGITELSTLDNDSIIDFNYLELLNDSFSATDVSEEQLLQKIQVLEKYIASKQEEILKEQRIYNSLISLQQSMEGKSQTRPLHSTELFK